MKIYELEVMACGTYTVIDYNDRSGCSDIEVECWQKAMFVVAAESVEIAARMIYAKYEKLNREWSNSCDTLYYNPTPVSVKDDEGDDEEILDCWFSEPRAGDGTKEGPDKYSKEAQ